MLSGCEKFACCNQNNCPGYPHECGGPCPCYRYCMCCVNMTARCLSLRPQAQAAGLSRDKCTQVHDTP